MRIKADNAREAAQICVRLESARAEARILAARIAAHPSVVRVLFFGSAATGRRFRLDSDLDLAVEGGDILSHLALTEASEFSVDVVDIPALPDALRDGIESECEVLYEKR